MAKLNSFYKLFLSFFLAAIGFSSCGKHNKVEAPEYGAPYEKLKLSGSVVDKNNNPISDIKLQLKFIVEDKVYNYAIATPITDKNGNIYYESNQTFTETFQVTFVKSNNTPSAQQYKDDSLRVKKVRTSNEQKGWMDGEAKANFTLKLQDE